MRKKRGWRCGGVDSPYVIQKIKLFCLWKIHLKRNAFLKNWTSQTASTIQVKNRAWSPSLPSPPSLLRHVFYIAAMLQVQDCCNSTHKQSWTRIVVVAHTRNPGPGLLQWHTQTILGQDCCSGTHKQSWVLNK